jgi:hypothetical protein
LPNFIGVQIEIERRKREGRGSPRKPAGKKKINERRSVFFWAEVWQTDFVFGQTNWQHGKIAR